MNKNSNLNNSNAIALANVSIPQTYYYMCVQYYSVLFIHSLTVNIPVTTVLER